MPGINMSTWGWLFSSWCSHFTRTWSMTRVKGTQSRWPVEALWYYFTKRHFFCSSGLQLRYRTVFKALESICKMNLWLKLKLHKTGMVHSIGLISPKASLNTGEYCTVLGGISGATITKNFHQAPELDAKGGLPLLQLVQSTNL